jgi:hypothetical protein
MAMRNRDRIASLLPLALALMACDAQYGNLGYNLPDECPGQCVPLPPLEFKGPALLWFGPAGEVPECPDRAPAPVFEGVDGVQNEPLHCPSCSCSQPTCAFPAEATASTSMCPGGGSTTPFPAPASWDGSCTSPGMVSSDQLDSLTIAPVTERPCEPIKNVPQNEEPGPSVTTRVLGCAGDVLDGVCPDAGSTCLPSAEPPPPGFQQCVMYIGPGDGSNVQCPGDYPERHVFYATVEDSRACTECTCTQTAAAQCSAWFSAYQDQACGEGLTSGVVSSAPICMGVSQGLTLGSMEATWITNEPGACEASGGEAIGEAKAADPRMFCCQPSPGGSS